jgi:hypothetical protein
VIEFGSKGGHFFYLTKRVVRVFFEYFGRARNFSVACVERCVVFVSVCVRIVVGCCDAVCSVRNQNLRSRSPAGHNNVFFLV